MGVGWEEWEDERRNTKGMEGCIPHARSPVGRTLYNGYIRGSEIECQVLRTYVVITEAVSALAVEFRDRPRLVLLPVRNRSSSIM